MPDCCCINAGRGSFRQGADQLLHAAPPVPSFGGGLQAAAGRSDSPGPLSEGSRLQSQGPDPKFGLADCTAVSHAGYQALLA